MRLVKLFGLAALAALTALALAGTGSAVAQNTVICEANEFKCAAGNVFEGKVEASLQEGTKAVLSIGPEKEDKVECQISRVEGETKSPLSWTGDGQLEAQINTLMFDDCETNPGGLNCTVHTEDVTLDQLPYQALLTQDEANQGDGFLEVFEKDNGQPGAAVTCTFNVVDCIFKVQEAGQEGTGGADVAKLRVEGGAPAKVHAEQVLLKQEEDATHTNCPEPAEQARWDAQYEITAPNPAFVSHE